MSVLERLNVGIVGAAGRGASFRAAFDAQPVTRIHAVCDIREEELAAAADRLGASETYTDYEEMLERAASLSDARCRFVSGGTFHSLAHRVLRNHAELLGYKNTFTILDRSDMETIAHSLVPELQIPKGSSRFPKRGTLANILSKAANVELPIDDLMMEEYGQFVHFSSQINRLGKLYKNYKNANQLMDYDDLILNLRILLEEHELFRSKNHIATYCRMTSV